MPATVSSSVACCCRCCNTGVCVRCSCVKAGTTCFNCVPGKSGRCRNITHALSTTCSTRLLAPSQNSISNDSQRDSQPSANSHFPSSAASFSPTATADPAPSAASRSASDGHLPSLYSIVSSASPTLLHVPKDARDTWAQILGDVCFSISRVFLFQHGTLA